jgi:hypothetical protein
MVRDTLRSLSEPPADPFRERRPLRWLEKAQLLGGQFQFETDSAALRRIVRHAFRGLPDHRLAGRGPRILVKLLVSSGSGSGSSRHQIQDEPPPVRPIAGAALLGCAMESANCVAISVRDREALIVVSKDMLRFPYHIRYELLEFAVYTLAARVQHLVPLHAACVGAGGKGLLVLGSSGAGKSTLALNCLLQGLEFVAEDSVLVAPRRLLATGLANFLHIRSDSRHLIGRPGKAAAALRASPTIHRRSGIEKLEIDLRRPGFKLAARPLPIAALVIVSAQSAARGALLRPLSAAVALEKLTSSQQYAASQPGWREFCKQVGHLPAFELRRGGDPLDSVDAVRTLLTSTLRRPSSGGRAVR